MLTVKVKDQKKNSKKKAPPVESKLWFNGNDIKPSILNEKKEEQIIS